MLHKFGLQWHLVYRGGYVPKMGSTKLTYTDAAIVQTESNTEEIPFGVQKFPWELFINEATKEFIKIAKARL